MSEGMPGVGMPMSGMPGMTATPGMPTAMGGMGAGMVASGAMSPGGSVPGAAAPAGMEGQMPAAHSKTFEIPNDMVGKLIGKGGETLKRIQYMSGARIQVDHTNTTGESRQVTVSGQSQTSVDRAHQMALEIITPETTTDESVAEEIQCPQDMVGRVIGRQGETVRALQQVTKVQVRINQDFPEGVPRKIVITGAPERVAECRDWLNRLLSDSTNEPMQQLMQAAQAAAGSNARILHAPKAIIAKIIGKGGSTIRDLQSKSGARIQIDQSVDPCVVSVAGNQQAVEAASRAVEDIIQGGNGFRTFQGGQGFGGGYGGMGLNFQRAFGSAAMYQGYGGYGGYQQAASAQGGTYGQGYDYSGYAQQPAFASPGYSGYTAQQGAFTAATGGSAGLTAAAALWRAIQDEQGRTYYYNTQTGQSQWEKPPGM